ncbi:MAG TPA: 5-formyltetrahydrofolate cyclo-ligase [Candidatus Lokiarchaeia archaeon]|nr:5-formyltetrahydrofolate cyclo-ligase [Candidatus Lokiarchaeia archaeon]
MTSITGKSTCKHAGGNDPANLLEQKEALRQKVKEQRYTMPIDTYQWLSMAIERRMMATKEYKAARRVCAYVHKEATREPATDAILLDVLANPEKELLVPITRVADCKLDITRLVNLEDLQPSTFDVLEPINEDLVAVDTIDIAIIPCLVVDTYGNRLGYGKGYYDKLLSELPASVPVFALAFEFEIVPSIPVTSHDKPVSAIVTEKRIIRCLP